MSNTRHASDPTEFNQERYASAYERGLLANMVAPRCQDEKLRPADRKLIWFVQLLSHREGIDALCERLKKRVQWKPFVRAADDEEEEESDCARPDWDSFAAAQANLKRSLRAERSLIKHEQERLWAETCDPSNFGRNIKELCTNPKFGLGTPISEGQTYRDLLTAEYRDYTERAAGAFVTTEIGLLIADALDFALKKQCLVVVEGSERIGKTVASKHWIEQHAGEARYVQCSAGNDDASFFRAFAESLGLSTRLTMKTWELKTRVQEVLQTKDLMVVIDEAAGLWPTAARHDSPPVRIEWLLKHLVNFDVPVALICTPQFSHWQEVVRRRVGWRDKQLTGRIKLFRQLPSEVQKSDLEKVARHLVPEGNAITIDVLVSYGWESQRYLAGIGTAVDRARYLAEKQGRAKVQPADIAAAINDILLPSENDLREQLSRASKVLTLN